MLLVVVVALMSTHPALAAFAGTNGKIVFSSNRDGNTEICVVSAEGSSQTRLTNNSAFDGQPNWSPDGNQIIFVSERDGNREIYRMNADGTGQTRLTNSTLNDQPAWQ